jgi:uncharacterized protein involved in response to NO
LLQLQRELSASGTWFVGFVTVYGGRAAQVFERPQVQHTPRIACNVSDSVRLQVQNRIDDLAMVFERLQAMVTGQDPLATALFFWRMLLLAAALWLAGPERLLFGWWCWEVSGTDQV